MIALIDHRLLPYLRGFRQRATSPDTNKYKIGEIFVEIKSRFRSGYSLRYALELIGQLGFNSQDEKHELSNLYEAKIKNMGNAGRNLRLRCNNKHRYNERADTATKGITECRLAEAFVINAI